MQDVSHTGTNSAVQRLNGALATESASTGTFLETRTRLAHALQTSLNANELVSLFHRHAHRLINYSGLVFQNVNEEEIQIGRKAVHSCHYNLNLPNTTLGSICFYSKQRFSTSDQQCLETLLGSLAFPLLNAQKYQNALRMALIDPLTQIGNRAALDKALEREHQLLQRSGQVFALLMIDIDHFKEINDKYGHAVGDKILSEVAMKIENVSRSTDMTFRFGGEEFGVILSSTGAAGALITAERVRRAIEQMQVSHKNLRINTTVSIGVSACMHAEESLSLLIERADTALYNAKRSGRNRSCCETPPPHPIHAS
ncbi:GGDEF domain-containing protein [Gilvimarinus chinensis]|uniref:GGDEF domain-containing protein n=1 Tax=Gilvimarinus chinensis TaxID=396005 RepID=UPI00037F194C|nr:GGDEF domain-containing protein [Gilvimarinus chinensis]